ncbi:hypothetical protein F4827_003548 [Paraburkholderia bannensis]|uniref:Uncharacterized protein n=1 Tax=Paraburkholderia bannensis TaxID=765414 RepID=A0A7W9WUD1_9BURK|nr:MULTISPECIES: hypothetical protein [Paraburkholderia]MBB3258679.1 hypothetical protein [Paraburkholderia sp. WP4_3_2]MBB6103693.1 hypothetical protein [Paraburkholderia bannensis]
MAARAANALIARFTMLIEAIEYVIFRHPNLAAVRDFMADHGLLDLQQGGGALDTLAIVMAFPVL